VPLPQPGAPRYAITLGSVRGWALAHGMSRAAFLVAYRTSLVLAIGRLTQAVYRERLCPARVVDHPLLGTCVVLGGARALLVPIVTKTFCRLDARSLPRGRPELAPLERGGSFLRRLAGVLEDSPAAAYRAKIARDFHNSLANLVLNRLLKLRRKTLARALEPAHQGHHYYPFPGLRVGPTVEQVAACSHLNDEAVALALLQVGTHTFRSSVFASTADCFAAWAGARVAGAANAIPVHPWQLQISPVVRDLMAVGAVRLLRGKVRCLPLASQRTLRVAATGYDVKLAVDAAVTSEHRLIFRLNAENAPAVSALVARVVSTCKLRLAFGIQADVASLSLAEPGLAAHLTAIVREPLRTGASEQAIPAIELWTGRERATDLLRNAGAGELARFFRAYCRVLMQGPVAFLLRFGLAFEPHLQNSIIVLRGGAPVRLILRDLDGTVMERARVAPLLSAFGLELAPDTWDHMPSVAVGEHRLVHSLFFGHIVETLDFLATRCGARSDVLLAILAREWHRLRSYAASRAAHTRFEALDAHLTKGKSMLMQRLAGVTAMRFTPLPKHRAFVAASEPFWHELEGLRARAAAARPRRAARGRTPIRASARGPSDSRKRAGNARRGPARGSDR
jgi:siderophore synthetase component